jgi:SP family myo-inositol transporter-like MFS transporter 13
MSLVVSSSAGMNWSWNLVVSLTFLSLTTALTTQGAFYLYCGLAVLAVLLFGLVLPETRGVPLEQMAAVFSGSLIVACRKPLHT